MKLHKVNVIVTHYFKTLLKSQTDLESKSKIFTRWLQSIPIQLIEQAPHSFKITFVKIISAAIFAGNLELHTRVNVTGSLVHGPE